MEQTMNGFNRDTFVTADRETRDKMVFDMLTELYKSVESQKWVNRMVSAGSGLIGGICVVIGHWVFFRGALG